MMFSQTQELGHQLSLIRFYDVLSNTQKLEHQLSLIRFYDVHLMVAKIPNCLNINTENVDETGSRGGGYSDIFIHT